MRGVTPDGVWQNGTVMYLYRMNCSSIESSKKEKIFLDASHRCPMSRNLVLIYVGSAANAVSTGQLGHGTDLAMLRDALEEHGTQLRVVVLDPIYSPMNGELTREMLYAHLDRIVQADYDKFEDYLNLGLLVEVRSMCDEDWVDRNRNRIDGSTVVCLDNTGRDSSFQMPIKNTLRSLAVASGCIAKPLAVVDLLGRHGYNYTENAFPFATGSGYDPNSGDVLPHHLPIEDKLYVYRHIDALFVMSNELLKHLNGGGDPPEWVLQRSLEISGTCTSANDLQSGNDLASRQAALQCIVSRFLSNNFGNADLDRAEYQRLYPALAR